MIFNPKTLAVNIFKRIHQLMLMDNRASWGYVHFYGSTTFLWKFNLLVKPLLANASISSPLGVYQKSLKR